MKLPLSYDPVYLMMMRDLLAKTQLSKTPPTREAGFLVCKNLRGLKVFFQTALAGLGQEITRIKKD